jgi:hypothetical protein
MNERDVAIADMIGDLMADGLDEARARDLAEQQYEENEASMRAMRARAATPAYRAAVERMMAQYENERQARR